MKNAAQPGGGNGSTVEKACAYCGARLRVLATRAPGHDVPHDVSCPECGKEFRVEANAQPEVVLLRPRTDGKRDNYQQTMF
jgi:hypothetical protein